MATITRKNAVDLFKTLGIQTAEKWNAKRLTAKLLKIDELVDDDTTIEDDGVCATLALCLEAIDNGTEIHVAEPLKEAAPKEKAEPKKVSKAKTKPVTKPVTKPEPEAKKESAAEPTSGTGGTRTLEKLGGMREVRTRPFLAGVVIRNAGGIEAGITEDMVAELDELYGKANRAESFYNLRDAWHIIRGYTKGDA